jgi:hypothetical protein
MNAKATPKTTDNTPAADDATDAVIGCLEVIATSLETLAGVAWAMIPPAKREEAKAFIDKQREEGTASE